MWGGLRQSLANVAAKGAENIQTPGRLIAKIGQVVAPRDFEEEEEYEEEEEEYNEEEEEYNEEEEEEEEVYKEEEEYEEYKKEENNSNVQLVQPEEDEILFSSSSSPFLSSSQPPQQQSQEEEEEESQLQLQLQPQEEETTTKSSFMFEMGKYSFGGVLQNALQETTDRFITHSDPLVPELQEQELQQQNHMERVSLNQNQNQNHSLSLNTYSQNQNKTTEMELIEEQETKPKEEEENDETKLKEENENEEVRIDTRKHDEVVSPPPHDVQQEQEIQFHSMQLPQQTDSTTFPEIIPKEGDTYDYEYDYNDHPNQNHNQNQNQKLGEDEIPWMEDKNVIQMEFHPIQYEEENQKEDWNHKTLSTHYSDNDTNPILLLRPTEHDVELEIETRDPTTPMLPVHPIDHPPESLPTESPPSHSSLEDPPYSHPTLNPTPNLTQEDNSNSFVHSHQDNPKETTILIQNTPKDLLVPTTMTQKILPSADYQHICQERDQLQSNVALLQTTIAQLQSQILRREEYFAMEMQETKRSHEEEIHRLLEDTQESHSLALRQVQNEFAKDMEVKKKAWEESMELHKKQTAHQIQQLQRLLEESKAQSSKLEADGKSAMAKSQAKIAELEKRNAVALERAESKMTQMTRECQEKGYEIEQLKNVIQDMKTTLKENVEGAEAAEEEADELHQENEELHKTIENLQKELDEARIKMKEMEEDQSQLFGVRMELQMIKEDRERQRDKVEALQESHSTNYSKVVAERDAAMANAADLEQQLGAITADLNVARSDHARLMAMNTNLQRAFEAFQVERESELAILEESRIASEDALRAAHKAELKAVKEASEKLVTDIQSAADKAILNMMQELTSAEGKVEEYRKEVVATRRSLDEAIHQLQRNQEDVIDRLVIKNILLDWFSKSGKAKKDVTILLSNLLHFTEDEKEKCGIGNSGAIGKVVVNMVPPLTPGAASVEQLEGDTVRDKFVNFLLAELGDDSPSANR